QTLSLPLTKLVLAERINGPETIQLGKSPVPFSNCDCAGSCVDGGGADSGAIDDGGARDASLDASTEAGLVDASTGSSASRAGTDGQDADVDAGGADASDAAGDCIALVASGTWTAHEPAFTVSCSDQSPYTNPARTETWTFTYGDPPTWNGIQLHEPT